MGRGRAEWYRSRLIFPFPICLQCLRSSVFYHHRLCSFFVQARHLYPVSVHTVDSYVLFMTDKSPLAIKESGRKERTSALKEAIPSLFLTTFHLFPPPFSQVLTPPVSRSTTARTSLVRRSACWPHSTDLHAKTCLSRPSSPQSSELEASAGAVSVSLLH